MSNALSRLLVVSENYPQLRATQGFQNLQAQLEGTENRIAVARMDFNTSAQAYNTARMRFPTNLIAGVLVPLAGALRNELHPGGTLLASGIFIDREAAVVSAFEAVGLAIRDRSAEGEWVALAAARQA